MHIQLIEQHHQPGRYLGRHIEHDPRSLDYAAPVLPRSARRSVVWQRRIPILNQGNKGTCTGNAFTGVVGTDSAGRTASPTVTVKADTKGVFTAGERRLDETFAVDAYSLNTRLDSIRGEYPPTDTGSSSLACGKTGKELGILSGYLHAFSYDAAISALQSGPILFGIPWLASMDEPDDEGMLTVSEASGVRGGHELMSREYDAVHDRVWIDNSWDTTWGVTGRAWLRGRDFAALLADGGDVLVPRFTVAA
jgi:hypothetical protein